jgi:hypothetical protein
MELRPTALRQMLKERYGLQLRSLPQYRQCLILKRFQRIMANHGGSCRGVTLGAVP